MKKLLRLRTMLLLCALIAGSGSVWAENETVASGTFNKTTYTDGWTVSGTPGTNSNNCVVIGKDDAITSPTMNLSVYTNVTISIKARRFGTLTGSKATIDASINSTSVGTVDATGTNANTSLSDISFTPDGTMTAVQIVFTCTNATSAGSTHGAGINTITIKGTKPDGTATTTTIVSTGITNTYINKGTSAGKLSFTVTETERGAAVDGATVTWDSSNKSVATIADDGTVTLVGVGSTDLTATYTGDATYVGSSDKYTLTVTDSRADAELVVEDDFEMEVTTTKAIADLYLTESDGEVTVTSASPAVVKVEDGLLKALSVGSAVITVSVAATDDYAAASDQITVTVTAKEAVEPVGPAAGAGWVLVTDASTLSAGDNLLITSTGTYTASKVTYDFSWAMAAQDGTKRNATDVEINEGSIASAPNDAQIVTLESAEGGKWYLNVGENSYLNSGNKEINTSSTKEATTITISDNNATIVVGDYKLQCNPNSGNPRFAYYSSTQKPIQLYRQNKATTFDVTISSAGYKTLVSNVDFKTQTGTTAYIVTASSASSATLTSVSEVPAGTPVILKGSGTVTLDVIDNAAAVNGNLLQVSTESTGNGVYVLADKDGVGFYKWTGGSLGAGRVYLPAPAAAAREFLSFDFEETTGINNVESSKLDVEGFYNLAGQRVAQPTKGLYIVNGKKVIIK